MQQTRGRILYKKVLLAYDGSVEGRLALREGAKLAQYCGAEVFLLAVVEPSFGATLEGGVMVPIDDQIATYQAILDEGVKRLQAIALATARLGMGAADRRSQGVAERSEPTSWSSVIVRPARWRDGGSARSAAI